MSVSREEVIKLLCRVCWLIEASGPYKVGDLEVNVTKSGDGYAVTTRELLGVSDEEERQTVTTYRLDPTPQVYPEDATITVTEWLAGKNGNLLRCLGAVSPKESLTADGLKELDDLLRETWHVLFREE